MGVAVSLHMSDAHSPTLRLRRLDASTYELTELMREGRLATLFQPIVDPRSRGICGFEALVRGPSDSWLHSPQNLFEAARRSGVKVELDFVCMQNAFKRFVAARVAGQLFINVSPDSIYEEANFGSRFLGYARDAGLAPAGFQLMGTLAGVVIALAQVLLPIMVVTLYGVIRSIDRDLENAAMNLGASPAGAVALVTVRLAAGGIAAGSLLVFSLAVGAFATPSLIGGARAQLMAVAIQEQTLELLDWPFAAAMSASLFTG